MSQDRPIPPYPSLPIVTPDPPARRSEGEKYGALFYLGIAGLVVLVGLIGWFAYGVWSLNRVWKDIYILHDEHRTEAERVQAAFELSRDPRLGAEQKWEIVLRKPLPEIARYVLAESLTPEIYARDRTAYVAMVAKSKDWPAWLRVLALRPVAFGTHQGDLIAPERLAPLRENPDPVIALWANFCAARSGDRGAAEAVKMAVVDQDSPHVEMARQLLRALENPDAAGTRALNDATSWLRAGYPPAARVWANWEIRGDRLVAKSAPKLQ